MDESMDVTENWDWEPEDNANGEPVAKVTLQELSDDEELDWAVIDEEARNTLTYGCCCDEDDFARRKRKSGDICHLGLGGYEACHAHKQRCIDDGFQEELLDERGYLKDFVYPVSEPADPIEEGSAFDFLQVPSDQSEYDPAKSVKVKAHRRLNWLRVHRGDNSTVSNELGTINEEDSTHCNSLNK